MTYYYCGQESLRRNEVANIVKKSLKFNSDDHYIYDGGQESLGRNGVAIIVDKSPKMQYLNAIPKMTE